MKRAAATLALAASALVRPPARASHLPIRTYTTADGLARDHVLAIAQDSRGFLWFATAEGLSRFDGYAFTNYGAAQGLPAERVEDFLETRAGEYWVATSGGLCRFDPSGPSDARFVRVPLGGAGPDTAPAVLYEDAAGAVWCGSGSGEGGLYRKAPGEGAFRRVDVPLRDPAVTAVLVDRRGSLWVGGTEGFVVRGADGRWAAFGAADGFPNPYVMALLEDRDGAVWIGMRGGLVRARPGEGPGAPNFRKFGPGDGLPAPRVESLLQTKDGTLWVGTTQGLARKAPGPGDRWESFSLAQGLAARTVGALAEDRDGNLWVGTFGSGAMKIARNGFTTFTEADGAPQASALLLDRAGEVCLVHVGERGLGLARFDGARFEPIRPRWPARITYFGWGRGQIAVSARSGEWWVATGQGLCRFAPVARAADLDGARPRAVYGPRDGLAGENVFRVYEDARGGIWVGTLGPRDEDGLARLDPAAGRARSFGKADGLPPHPAPTCFAEDGAGELWVGLFHGGLARRRGERFEFFGPQEGVSGVVHEVVLDSKGRLWAATSDGLLRCDDPQAPRPAFVRYDARHGLSSREIGAIVEDAQGRFWAATGRGVDRFEAGPAGPGRVRRFTTADGIPPGELQLALRDREGALWFSTPLGVARLVPAADRPRAPPPILVTGVTAGGVAQPVSGLGQREVAGLELKDAPVRFDFVGFGFAPGEALRYQYRLEGEDPDWGPPTDQRAVVYAGLPAGRHRFLVRAVASDGLASAEPATVAFRILPPVWRRPWFLALSAAAAALAAWAFYRARLAHALAVGEVRTRIATDLHDDIGSSLSQIAILSEVARRKASADAGRESALAEIAAISRGLVDAMSDIVWAINPEHDRVSDLTHRMRRFANDVVGGPGIALRFRSAPGESDPGIGANARRQVWLVFKEAIHNAVRHAAPGAIDVGLAAQGSHLVLTVADDGCGFDAAAPSEGNGLASMRRRAASVGGTLGVESAPGRGTTVTLSVPLRPQGFLSALRGGARRGRARVEP